MYWNVAGLASKVIDPKWGTVISKYNIILLEETWVQEPVPRLGYSAFCLEALDTKHGHASGGRLIWVRISVGC